jgi:hypothetical protein
LLEWSGLPIVLNDFCLIFEMFDEKKKQKNKKNNWEMMYQLREDSVCEQWGISKSSCLVQCTNERLLDSMQSYF